MIQQVTLPPRALAALAGLALLWGFSFLAMRIALDEIGPVTLVAHRTGWAALVLWGVVLVRRCVLPRDPVVWGALAMMGLLNNVVPFSLIAFGQQHIETGLGSILNASTAIWGVLLAAVLLPDERLTPRKVAGVALGFVGVAVAIGLDTLRAFDLRSVSQLAFLGAGLSYALAGVWARRRLRGVRPDVAATGMLTASAAMMLPAAVLLEGGMTLMLAPRTLVALAYAALGATARAYAGFALVALGLAVLDGRIGAWLHRKRQKRLASGASHR